MKNSVSRIGWIDGLKGLSIIIVVMYHIFLALNGQKHYSENFLNYNPVLRNFINGQMAVSVFIILSAYLTCHGLERRHGNPLSAYTDILSKRYFRLLFPVGLIILLMKISNETGLSYADEYGLLTCNDWLQEQDCTWLTLPGRILLSPFGYVGPILNVAWMLGYVFVGTFLVIAVDILMRDKNRRAQIFLYALMSVLFFLLDPLYVNVVAAHALYRVNWQTGGGKMRLSQRVGSCINIQ